MPTPNLAGLIKRLRMLQRFKHRSVSELAREAADALEKQEVELGSKIRAAEVLGIEYGEPGPRLPETYCRKCWGDRYVWLGNVWGLEHQPKGQRGSCSCKCHEGEVWMASAKENSDAHI